MGKKMWFPVPSMRRPILVVLQIFILLGEYPVHATDNRIVGGRPAEEGEFPYQVSLRRSYNDKHFCGGSLITENHVLTAAHCMYYQWGGILPPIVVSVVAGQLNITMKNDTVFRNVSEIVVHPQYNKTSMENDVAILKLTHKMPMTHVISVIELAQRDNMHKTCIVSGWGVQEFTSNEISESLLATEVTRISSELCDDMYGNDTIMESMLCAHDEEGEHDACQGDSGGPLVCSGLLIGVISTGEGCANKLYPGIYANVTYLYDWIYDNVRLTNETGRETDTVIVTEVMTTELQRSETVVTNNDNNQEQESHTEHNKSTKISTAKQFNTTNKREYNTSSTTLNGHSLVKDDSYYNNTKDHVHISNFSRVPDGHNGSKCNCAIMSVLVMTITIFWTFYNL